MGFMLFEQKRLHEIQCRQVVDEFYKFICLRLIWNESHKSHYFFGIKSPKVITVSEKRMVLFLPFERDSHYACHDVVRECFEAQGAEAEARVERNLEDDAGFFYGNMDNNYRYS